MSIFSTSLEGEFIDIGAFAAELSGAEQLTALANVASRESVPIDRHLTARKSRAHRRAS